MKRILPASLLLLAATAAVAQQDDTQVVVIHQARPTYTRLDANPDGSARLSRVAADPGFAAPGTYATPLSIGIAPPVQIGDETWDVIGLRIGLPYSAHNNVYGFDVDLFASETRGDFGGIQVAGLYNHVEHDVFGIQLSGVVNSVDGAFTGIQLAGAANLSSGPFWGVQVAGIANLCDDSPVFTGIQLALYNDTELFQGLQVGLLDFAADVNGAQVGLVNVAASVRGLQIGLFNAAESLQGVQIGLSNYIADSQLRWFPILNACF